MATIIGSLQIEMSANVARLQQDMGQAKGHVKNATEEMVRAAEMARGALEAIGIGLGVVEFKEFISRTIESADRLQDLSKTTSLSIEQLSGLGLAAKQSGTDLEGISASINKLSVNMGKDAEKFKSLGISAKDPIEALKQLSDIYVSLQDPQQRAAVMAEALGKSWAIAAPLLAEGGKRIGEMVEKGTQLSGITKEMSEQAHEFNDRMAELHMILGKTSQQLIGNALPAMNRIAEAMGEAAKDGGLLKAALVGVGGVLSGIFTDDQMTRAQQIAKELKQLREDNASAQKWGNPLAFFSDSMKEKLNAELDMRNQRMIALQKELEAIQKLEDEKKKSNFTEEEAMALAKKQYDAWVAANKFLGGSTVELNTKLLSLEERILRQTDIYKLSAESAEKLTETEKMRIEFQDALKAGTLTATNAEQKHIGVMLQRMAMEEAAAKQHDEERKAHLEATKVIERANLAAAESIDMMQFEVSLWGKSAEEMQRLTALRAIDLKTRKEILALQLNETINKDARALHETTAATLAQADADKKAALAKLQYQQAITGKGLDKGATEADQYQSKLKALEDYHLAAKTDEQIYNTLMQQLERDHRAALIQIAVDGGWSLVKFDENINQARFEVAAKWMQNTIGAAAQHSRAMFSMNKALSLAQAAVKLPETVMDAYAWGTKFGGPPGGTIAAGIALAAQLVNMQAIQSAQFGGSMSSVSAGGGNTGAGASAIPGQITNSSVASSPSSPSALVGVAKQAPQQINITIVGAQGNPNAPVISYNTFVNDIVPMIKAAKDNGYLVDLNVAMT